jgi:hypothetical protein
VGCDAFYKVVYVGIHIEHDLLKVMNQINELKIELTCNESSKVLDPTTTRSKRHPPSKRKASKVDQIVQKKLAGKKTENRKKRSNSYFSQEVVTLKIFKFIFSS